MPKVLCFKNSPKKTHLILGATQAEFLNFTIYLLLEKVKFKNWRLSKNVQIFFLAKTCAIYYIHGPQEYFINRNCFTIIDHLIHISFLKSLF
jgi:hypothetical protein